MEHTHNEEEFNLKYIVLSGIMLLLGILATAFHCTFFLKPYVALGWYLIAIIPIGFPIIKEAIHLLCHHFTMGEHLLMSIASIGAFCLGEYAEGVAVIWLYSLGELLQDKAVDKAKDSIRAMIALKETTVKVLDGTRLCPTKIEDVALNSTIVLFKGEQLPLDGTLVGRSSAFNTAALTGESEPKSFEEGNEVLAGMIALEGDTFVKVTRKASQSAMARILKMVEEATERKAPTERFIRRFAKVYTPFVVACAALLVLLPWIYSFINPSYHYESIAWIKHALVFLVLSCPCALVVSVPLSYFIGMGEASKKGVLLKGSNFLDALSSTDVIAFDKTGTLTTGSFTIKEINNLNTEEQAIVAQIEAHSTHPVAQAVAKELPLGTANVAFEHLKEVSGKGVEAQINGDKWLVGTLNYMAENDIVCPKNLEEHPTTLVVCAKNGKMVGYITLEDQLKPDTLTAIAQLKALGTKKIVVLSGDKKTVVEALKTRIGADEAYGECLPSEKLAHVERMKQSQRRVFFVGDGINDAPVLASSHVAIAMGKQGSDMAIETADVVLQFDKPSQLPFAIKLGKRVKQVVRFNVGFSIGTKILLLGASFFGFESLWLAIFADTGVALLTILIALFCLNFYTERHQGV